ncbi:IS3 family transposase, partial [Paraburkholderia lacunae]|uniref:IS3 family transposase n=1 Tax=Paraburkholderia lacunae TaxID=2211104 RepID=UPI001FCC692C
SSCRKSESKREIRIVNNPLLAALLFHHRFWKRRFVYNEMGLFGRLKTELFYPRDWRATTVEQFIEAVDSYIRWYNAKRIKISLGSLSPLEYRESLRIAA